MAQIGSYKLVKFLNSGTYGGVWECRNVTSGELFACKIVDFETCKNRTFFEHFKNELLIHGMVCHPGITQLKDILTDDENVYVIIELCNGGDLSDLVNSSNGLSEAVARRYFCQIMEAVAYVHSFGIAHRDIKLDNVLLDSDQRVKLTDFGLCKIQENSLLSTKCGTLIYTAPEIVKAVPYDGAKADIWSAGIMLYAMVCNRFPWDFNESLSPDQLAGETARQIQEGHIHMPDGISFDLSNLLENMLSLDPQDRPDAREVLQHPWVQCDTDHRPSAPLQTNSDIESLVKSTIRDLERRLSQ